MADRGEQGGGKSREKPSAERLALFRSYLGQTVKIREEEREEEPSPIACSKRTESVEIVSGEHDGRQSTKPKKEEKRERKEAPWLQNKLGGKQMTMQAREGGGRAAFNIPTSLSKWPREKRKSRK